uniref:Class II aldolase/adducin N-terminal domain-containing protein n=1 Tax=Trichogramma kaykai TaxID=54128 RepID=A0ABD2W6R8_9HYME
MAMLHLMIVANAFNKALMKSMSSRLDLTDLLDDKMADSNQQEEMHEVQTNGAVDGLTEEEKAKMRPADIEADVRDMERRKRVEAMMSSRLFREELERIIETQMKDGSAPSGILQQISEMMGIQGSRFNSNGFKNSNCVLPINDIRGVESMGYAKGEKNARCKLAAVYRLIDLYGWTQGVNGMITARLSQDKEHFLVNPYGLLYHEITASSLIKVDMQGGVVEQGTTNFAIHMASYQLHSTIHAARPDIKCVVHIATPSVTAVSSTKAGVLPLSQESIVIGEVSSHHYVGGGASLLDPDERDRLARNLGPVNKVILLANRGALCCGETIEEAFYNVYNTVIACETQAKLMTLGIDNLTLIPEEARKAIYEASRKAPVPPQSSVSESAALAEKLEKRWRIGGTEFEALMRMLDNAGFRTGYLYRNPLIKSEPPRPKNDVEVPPAVSSLGFLLEEEELFKQGLWKGGRKVGQRTRWLNSPHSYQKVEILETGTPDPKKITKWVSDGSPTHSSTPVKIDGALQFVPKNTNPKEFKQLQQQIKDYRRADKISAGPQSHILEGVTWEEAKKMQDATISGTGEQVVLVGAASKGIIQRGFQHNAMVYKAPYAKNPFDAVTDQELDQYKKEVERKTKGDPYDESQSESEALSSFNITSTAKSPVQSPVSVTSETEEESRDEPKVLYIGTKQVPAPSQPEVVLSDDKNVNTVTANPVELQEIIKSETLKVQTGSNIKSVNAAFINELRRSEMMNRSNANGRGLSGVSSLSSRSDVSCTTEDNRLSSLNKPQYPPCYLETARTRELPRPEHYYKLFSTPLQRIHAARVEFLKEAFCGIKTEEQEAEKNVQEGSSTEIKTELNDVECKSNSSMNFAEKVYLPVENAVVNEPISNERSSTENSDLEVTEKMGESNSNSSDSLEEKTFVSELFIDIKDDKEKTYCSAINIPLEDYRREEFANEVETKHPEESHDSDSLPETETNYSLSPNQLDYSNRIRRVYHAIGRKSSTAEESFDSEQQKLQRNSTLCESDNDNNENYISEYNVEFPGSYVLCKESKGSDIDTQNDLETEKVDNEIIDKDEYEYDYLCEGFFDTQSIKDLPINEAIEKCSYSSNALADKQVGSQNSSRHGSIVSLNNLDGSKTDNKDSEVVEIDLKDEVKSNMGECDEQCDNIDYAWEPECNEMYDLSHFSFGNESFSNQSFGLQRTGPACEDLTRIDELDSVRRDSLVNVIIGMNGNITPSKINLDPIPRTENSTQYNLSPENMKEIYSITPQCDDTLATDSTSSTSGSSNDIDQCRIKESYDQKMHDAIKEETTEEVAEEVAEEIAEDESEILELLNPVDDELFHKQMSTSFEEIHQELSTANVKKEAIKFIKEILDEVSKMNPLTGSYKSKQEIQREVRERMESIKMERKITNDIIQKSSIKNELLSETAQVHSNFKINEPTEPVDGVYVVHELIHHIVNKNDNEDIIDRSDSHICQKVADKEYKETTNTKLKELRIEYEIKDERSLMSTAPITTAIELPPNSINSSNQTLDVASEPEYDDVYPFDSEKIIESTAPDCDSNNNDTKNNVSNNSSVNSTEEEVHLQSTNLPFVSTNYIFCTESYDFGDQEAVESTDSDTKSDDSKEKPKDIEFGSNDLRYSFRPQYEPKSGDIYINCDEASFNEALKEKSWIVNHPHLIAFEKSDNDSDRDELSVINKMHSTEELNIPVISTESHHSDEQETSGSIDNDIKSDYSIEKEEEDVEISHYHAQYDDRPKLKRRRGISDNIDCDETAHPSESSKKSKWSLSKLIQVGCVKGERGDDFYESAVKDDVEKPNSPYVPMNVHATETSGSPKEWCYSIKQEVTDDEIEKQEVIIEVSPEKQKMAQNKLALADCVKSGSDGVLELATNDDVQTIKGQHNFGNLLDSQNNQVFASLSSIASVDFCHNFKEEVDSELVRISKGSDYSEDDEENDDNVNDRPQQNKKNKKVTFFIEDEKKSISIDRKKKWSLSKFIAPDCVKGEYDCDQYEIKDKYDIQNTDDEISISSTVSCVSTQSLPLTEYLYNNEQDDEQIEVTDNQSKEKLENSDNEASKDYLSCSARSEKEGKVYVLRSDKPTFSIIECDKTMENNKNENLHRAILIDSLKSENDTVHDTNIVKLEDPSFSDSPDNACYVKKESDSEESVNEIEETESIQNEVEKLWQLNEEKMDTYCREARICDESTLELEEGIANCEKNLAILNEKTKQLYEEMMAVSAETIDFDFEINEDELNPTSETHHQFQRVDDLHEQPLNLIDARPDILTNASLLSTIMEDPELEKILTDSSSSFILKNAFPNTVSDNLSAVVEDTDCINEVGDPKISEHSSRSSTASPKSEEEQFPCRTYDLEEITDSEMAYSADVSRNDGRLQNTVCRNDSTISETRMSAGKRRIMAITRMRIIAPFRKAVKRAARCPKTSA